MDFPSIPSWGRRAARNCVRAGGLLLAAVVLPSFAAEKERWDPVPPEDLTAPPPNAQHTYDAEILISRMVLIDHAQTVEKKCYRRVKIGTAKGAEDFQHIEIAYIKGNNVFGLAARIIHSDGSIREIPEREFQECTVVKQGDAKLQTKQAMMPHAAVGDIIEWQWQEKWPGSITTLFYCQEEFPVRDFEFVLTSDMAAVCVVRYNFLQSTVKKLKYGTQITAHNLPAFVAEPYMPPAFENCASIFVGYGEGEGQQRQGWAEKSESLRNWFVSNCEVTSRIRTACDTLLTGATHGCLTNAF